jgi:peptidyl-prolyl cis-trans isomerase C
MAGVETDQASMMTGHSKGMWRRLLGEPLVHFFVVGALVFGAYQVFNEAPASVNEQTIEISANEIRQIAIGWVAQGRPLPTQDQMQSLIDQRVAEEVLFREGLALGLDRNDEIIKRRVAQKMDFLAADIAAMQMPDRAELTEWYSAHSDEFAIPPRISFRHFYFSPDKRGIAARSDAAAAFKAIAGKTADSPEIDALADPFMLRSYYSNSTPDLILKEFGPGFSSELFKLEPGGWRGPVQSGFGWHLVWIDTLEPGRIPSFDEVQADVKSAWTDARYAEIKRAALEEMSARYRVVVPSLETIDMSNLLGTDQAPVYSPEIIPQ